MSAKNHIESRVLSVSERERLERERARHLQGLNGDIPGADRRTRQLLYSPQSRSSYEEGKLREIEGVLSREGADRDLSPKDLDYLAAKSEELEQWMKPQMLSVDELYMEPSARNAIKFNSVVNRHTKFEMSQQFTRVARAWKNIQRLLEPDNPDADKLDRIRPEKRD